MRSWLAQSLTALEDMVDSGKLSEEEVANLAKASLAVRGLSLSLAPLAPATPEESGAHPVVRDTIPESTSLRHSTVVPREMPSPARAVSGKTRG